MRTLRSPIYWWADVFDPQPGPPNPAGQALFEATQMVAADGIMVDLPGHGLRFEPDTPLTRQDGAVILMRMIHALTPLQTCAGTPYVDVPCDFTSRYPYIQALKNASYLPPSTIPDPNCTSGPIDATHFQPTCAMRRRDWVRFMMTALQQFPFYSPTPHFDVPPGDPDYGNIEGALALGLLDVSSGPFNAEGPLTRGAAARMAYGAISRIVYAIP